jgi:hypothetical protein
MGFLAMTYGLLSLITLKIQKAFHLHRIISSHNKNLAWVSTCAKLQMPKEPLLVPESKPPWFIFKAQRPSFYAYMEVEMI